RNRAIPRNRRETVPEAMKMPTMAAIRMQRAGIRVLGGFIRPARWSISGPWEHNPEKRGRAIPGPERNPVKARASEPQCNRCGTGSDYPLCGLRVGGPVVVARPGTALDLSFDQSGFQDSACGFAQVWWNAGP